MSFDFIRRLRVLAVVLAVLIPVKTLAAVVIPITGMPGHHHEAAGDAHDATHRVPATGAPAGPDGVAPAAGQTFDPQHASQCAAHADVVAGGDGPHEHGCPHLGMASICTAVISIGATDAAPRATSLVDTPRASLVLDVPLPPPTV